MPNIGFPELIIILLVALMVFGPKKLPEMGKTVGAAMREFRRATQDVRAEIKQELDAPPGQEAEPAGSVPQAAETPVDREGDKTSVTPDPDQKQSD